MTFAEKTVVVALKGPPIRIGACVLNGLNVLRGTPAEVALARQMMPGGYALTLSVPAAAWDEWLRQNRYSALVTGNLIYADPIRSVVEAWCYANGRKTSAGHMGGTQAG